MSETHIRALLFLIPVLFGVLWLWARRNDRRQQFVDQRLHALTVRNSAPVPQLSVRRALLGNSLGFLPQNLSVWLDAGFTATGNRIRLLHLPIAGLVPAILVFGFFTRVLALGVMPATLLAVVTAALAPLLLLRMAQSHYQRKFLDVFPDALDLVGRGVKAGLPVTEALLVAGREMADPVGHELRRTFDQVQIGVPMIDALEQTANRIRVADFRFMVVALALQEKTGGSLAETLSSLSTVIRSRKALRIKARSLSAEAKVSAMILAALPFLVGGAMYVMNRDLMRLLFDDPRGRFMIGVAFLSLLTGLGIMSLMVKRAIR